ncbi:DNA replication initiation control protein YabA [Bacillaceae bacterium]
MVDKQEIFARVASIEEQIGELYKELGLLKSKIVELLEENKNLSVENEKLHRLLAKHGEKEGKKDKQEGRGDKRPVIGEGYDNLARLYQEGFHICNLRFGSLRTEGDCLFCLSFLSGRN